MEQNCLKKVHEQLLHDVQMYKVFADGKTFVDCNPKISLESICLKYEEEKEKPGFDLKEFVLANYDLPVSISHQYKSDPSKPVSDNIEALWPLLTRVPAVANGSLISLPFPYIVPGGRFGEIYYWDSYFTMLGLQVSGRISMIENMMDNFSHLIDQFGYIPNGNRNYFLGRSQPPFFASMIQLLAEEKGEDVFLKYAGTLKKEYDFWMQGADKINPSNNSCNRVVQMPDGELLNRYWDEHDTPRPESYREDVELAGDSKLGQSKKYRDLRAGAESGWDFSSRWFANNKDFHSIHTTDIIPVDLNCLLANIEGLLTIAFRKNNDEASAREFSAAAEKRKAAIQKYCWNESAGFYFDFDFVKGKQKTVYSLAATFPLFFKIATVSQAKAVAEIIETKFLNDGGLITTLENTGQQWDAPNGWAPLHWVAIKGFEHYQIDRLAGIIAGNWIKMCTAVFNRTGKMMEKYNVVDIKLEAGGGEYPGQDGFGWSNGVLLALIKKYG